MGAKKVAAKTVAKVAEKATTKSKTRLVTAEELDSPTLFAPPQVPRAPSMAGEIEDLHEQVVEARYKLVAALETQILNGNMDPTEGVSRFASIVLPFLNKTQAYEVAKTYLLNLGHTQVWAKAL